MIFIVNKSIKSIRQYIMSKTVKNQQENLPIFYQNPCFLNKDDYGDKGLNPQLKFSFAKNKAAVPITLVEMPIAMRDYPLLFIGDDAVTMAVIMGLDADKNLFIDAKNTWEDDFYIPAYIRRYPFILAEQDDNQNLVLCIDDTSNTIKPTKNNGFYHNGVAAAFVKNAASFAQNYFEAGIKTNDFCKTIKDMNLLSPLNLDLVKDLGFRSVSCIDEEKLKKLSEKDYLSLKKKGYIAFIYAQLFSMNNWQNLYQRHLNKK